MATIEKKGIGGCMCVKTYITGCFAFFCFGLVLFLSKKGRLEQDYKAELEFYCSTVPCYHRLSLRNGFHKM